MAKTAEGRGLNCEADSGKQIEERSEREQRNKAYFFSKLTSFVGSVAYEIPAKMP